ncbi:MAG: 2-oxo-hepta-3-ene-1,7-dioic acid hydratase [Paracoccaceae bacterium]|nr:2-oxo-hepta-3-ene-1,7-dioic acid hydratase [Paracoccaceae bacterium]
MRPDFKHFPVLADRLFEAERSRVQIGLISTDYPGITLDDAYAIQQLLIDRKVAAGRCITGWKIGLTSRAMQMALDIDFPDSGVIFDDMHFESGTRVPPDRFIKPRIEAEIVFIMNRDLDGRGSVSRDDVLAATESVCPSLEILDTRIVRRDPENGRTRTVFDTIADNAANAGIVLGPDRHRPGAHDLRRVGAIVTRNGIVEETGLGAGVLDDPALAVGWLAERLATCGQAIRAGDVVLSGSFTRPIEARPGDRFHADFGDFGIVDIEFGTVESEAPDTQSSGQN